MEPTEKLYDDRFRVMQRLVYLSYSHGTEIVHYDSKRMNGKVEGDIQEKIMWELLQEKPPLVKIHGLYLTPVKNRKITGVECDLEILPELYQVYYQWDQWYKENGCHVPNKKSPSLLNNSEHKNHGRVVGPSFSRGTGIVSFADKTIKLKPNTDACKLLSILWNGRQVGKKQPSVVKLEEIKDIQSSPKRCVKYLNHLFKQKQAPLRIRLGKGGFWVETRADVKSK